MNDNEIKQLLENLEVQPSARCWDAIESGIAAAGTTAGGTSAATKAAAQATRHLSSAAVKAIIAGSAVTIAVGGALVAALLLPNANTPSTPAESSLTAHTTSLPSPSATETPADTIAYHPVTAETYTSSPIAQEQLPEKSIIPAAAESATPSENSATPTLAVTHPASAPSTTPQPAHSTTTQNQPAPTPKANATPASSRPTATQSTSSQQPVTQTEDPVLTGRDDLDFTPPVAIEIPNVITPNSDGYNDLFVIKGIENCEKSKLIIRSKSGSVVLQVNDYQNNWDAQNALDGTYYYQFYYTIHGIEETRTGTLTIIR